MSICDTKKCLNYRKKKINGSNLENRSVIQDLWPHRHPHWESHTLFWHFCREKDKTCVVSRPLGVSCPPPGHCMTPGGRKARRGWPTAPSAQDTFCFLWLQSLRNRTTHYLNSFYHRAVSITNPLKRPPPRAATISGLPFFKKKNTKRNHHDVFLCKLFLLLNLNLCALPKWNEKNWRLLSAHFQSKMTMKLT